MVYLILGLAPGLFWLFYFYKKDKYEPEPKKLIIKTFLIGIIAAIPVIFIERIFGVLISPFKQSSIYLYYFFLCFFIIGPVEEYFKYAVVKTGVYNSDEFNEPMDGIVYCIAAALGFASIENIMYMISYGKSIIILRSITATVAHALNSGIIGYHLGLAKFNPDKKKYLIRRGFLIAVFLHGLYDFIIFIKLYYFGLILLLILILSFGYLKKKIKHALSLSPFKNNKIK